MGEAEGEPEGRVRDRKMDRQTEKFLKFGPSLTFTG